MKIKKSITMLIIPAFVLGTVVGCSESGSGVATQSQAVVQTPEGQFVQVADTLNKSYEQAKAGGYTGTYEEWVKLLELHQTNPQQASTQANSQGFGGMDMLMAGAMGMMLGNMMSNNGAGGYHQYKERQRSYGSSAYAPANANRMNSFRATENRAQSAVRSAQASKASAARSTASVSRGGFGGAVSSGG